MSEDDFGPDPSPAADMAAMYRKHGIQVVPALMPHEAKRPGEWKHPILKSWTEYQEALVPDETFQLWYGPAGKYRDRLNMGILTGRCSHNIFVIDLDTYKNAAATNWWLGVMALHNNGQDFETAEQITGGGGRQKLFQAPNNWQAPTNRTSLNVDVRGQGGFAVLAPSMHHTGNQYHWVAGRSPEDIGVAMAPDWLLDEVRALVEKYGGATASTHKSSANGEYQGQDRDAFGNRTDGREDDMYRTVCGCLVNWYRENPIRPSLEESAKKSRSDYEVYERRTRPQKEHPGLSLSEALDAEGRGWEVWQDKWQRLFKLWDTKVADMAREARPKQEAPKSPEFEKDPETGEPKALIVHGKDFIGGYKPPPYVINGLFQKGYAYCLTGPAGHGKTPVSMYAAAAVSLGKECQGRKTRQGSVLFLAGENVDDIRARYIAMADHDGFNPITTPFYFICGVIDIKGEMPRIKTEAAKIGDLSMIVVDTDQAYFRGEEGNSNEQRKWFAQELRELTQLPGNPCVLVNCHPVKSAGRDNLVPIGGSSFMNELDGNIMCWADDRTTTLRQHPAKWRGAPFEAMTFELKTINSPKLVDENGDYMPSVVAVSITDDAAQRRSDVAGEDDKTILRLLHADKKASMMSMAKAAGWTWPDGSPAKSKVQRVVDRLFKAKMIYEFHNGKYKLSKKGCRLIGVPLQGENDEE